MSGRVVDAHAIAPMQAAATAPRWSGKGTRALAAAVAMAPPPSEPRLQRPWRRVKIDRPRANWARTARAFMPTSATESAIAATAIPIDRRRGDTDEGQEDGEEHGRPDGGTPRSPASDQRTARGGAHQAADAAGRQNQADRGDVEAGVVADLGEARQPAAESDAVDEKQHGDPGQGSPCPDLRWQDRQPVRRRLSASHRRRSRFLSSEVRPPQMPSRWFASRA